MSIFKHLFINGRPACGKSEFIAFLKNLPAKERSDRFHIGDLAEIDDFPLLWKVFEEDNKREERGEKRLYTIRTPECFNITVPNLRSSLVKEMSKTITEKYLKNPAFYDKGTLLIEFARGRSDGFLASFNNFKKEILEIGAILHIEVSFDESVRRNNARYVESQKKSILFHKVPDKDMNEYFIDNDWNDLTGGQSHGYLEIQGIKIPFVTVHNEPELKDLDELGKRYEPYLKKLMNLYQKCQNKPSTI